jgi:hypothetical protein
MLPKIQHPIFSIKVPSLEKEGKFRQWLTREEKILLIAKQSTSTADKLQAVYQIVNNCAVDITPDKMTTSDVEWVFLKLREISVGATTVLTYSDPEDGLDYPVTVNLLDVKPPAKRDGSKILSSGDVKFEICDTKASLYLDHKLIEDGFDIDEVMAKSLIAVWDATGKKITEFTLDEAKELLDQVDPPTMGIAREYVSEASSMEYDVKYTNSKGTDRSIKLNSLPDFFSL